MQILIVADDYTGANDTAVLAAGIGFNAYTVLDRETTLPQNIRPRCLAVSTNSRGMESKDAYRQVNECTRMYASPETVIYSKRIDSTLRGNLGSEIDGMLDALGSEWAALVVPAFPGAGRVYKNGRLFVHGVPLSQTAAARDPKNPVKTDSALELLRQQSAYPVDSLGIDVVRRGPASILSGWREMRLKGIRLLLCEAETEEDLCLIAEALSLCVERFIFADPGAMTLRAAQRLIGETGVDASADAEEAPSSSGRSGSQFFLIGSINDVASSQVSRLLEQEGVLITYVDAARALRETFENTGAYGESLLWKMKDDLMNARTICLCTSGIFPDQRLDLKAMEKSLGISTDEISGKINEYMASLAARFITEIFRLQAGRNSMDDAPLISGLFACGGDTAVTLCRELGAIGEIPEEEVIPLAVYGRLVGGIADGMPIITKGGMIGDEWTLIRCRDYLENHK